jgi:hypothetical protein
VAAGQNSGHLDYTSINALTLSGGTINQTLTGGTNAAVLTLPAPGTTGSLGANKNLVIDTVAPTVASVTTTTANGTYGLGASISIQVTFNKNITVTGTPQLALNSGGTANFASASGMVATFTYVVAAGQNSPHLDYTSTTALTLSGGTINQTLAGGTNAANLTLPAVGSANSLAGSSNLVIDTVVPTVTNVTSPNPNATYGLGATITIQVTFSKNITVTGTPQLALNSGGTANFTSASGNVATFTYVVAAGQNSLHLDYASINALTLNGGTINQAGLAGGTNAANLTLPPPGTAGSLGFNKTLVVDSVSPAVSGVTSGTPHGTYGVGSTIAIIVTFTQAVDVTGIPLLALNSGGIASYTSGTGTTNLVFTYTVAAGQNSPHLDYTAFNALVLNGGTIKKAGGAANAILTLATPGAAGSLGASASLIIDTTPPPVAPPPAARGLFATGADAGGAPEVKVYDAATATLRLDFFAFDPFFTGGVRVAVGDVNGDGTPDIIVGAGPGGLPEVKVFDGNTAAPLYDFFAFSPFFTGGVFVAGGDINGDRRADIIVGADTGGAPEVKVFSGANAALLRDFYAYGAAFSGGVRVAAGDVNGDGFADIITGAGPGGAPEVKVFSDAGAMLQDYFALSPAFTGGIFVAAGDVDGDGKADVIVGAGPGGAPEVQAFSGVSTALLRDFFAYPPAAGILVPAFGDNSVSTGGGVHVGFASINGKGAIITGPGPGLPPEVKVFDALSIQMLDDFFAYDPGFLGGVFVGGN